jgi:HSP20 family protein
MTMFDPFADLSRLRQQIDRLYDQASPAPKGQQESGRVWRPPVDLFEDEDSLTLRVDLPGIDQSKLDVQIQADELVVRGERPWEKPEKGGCVHAERPYGPFHRVFRLGIPVQHDRIQAAYKHGVLTVVVPKAEAVKPRRIAVAAESE